MQLPQMVKTFMLIIGISLLSIKASIMHEYSRSYNYKFDLSKAGSVIPKGWIRNQLNNDLTQGYIGSYDQVHPTVTKNVFVNQHLRSKRRLGLRKEWWSGEHEGYWKDGVIRMAFLTNNKPYIEKARHWVDEIIQNTGNDGYIGIYGDCEKPGCRFNHKRGNGELWTTSRIVMALLAYYEFTNDEKVLGAAEKAVKLIMQKYTNKNYFATESRGGGVSHGIGFFENLEWLYRITGNKAYIDFALKLYIDFNAGNFRDDDLKTELLLNKSRLFQKHGAHIAEGLFVPRFIAAIDSSAVYQEAADNVLLKLEKHLTPGGAMRCDEWINGREGTADERYEYCGIAEMISPLLKMISFTGNLKLADQIETMAFNAGQGARFPVLTALSYLTSDNRFKINHREIVKRESYDAAHLAAVCCALNGSRLMPYFVEGMWMKDKNSNALMAILFGPCEFNTSVNNIGVSINEETTYPFSDTIRFTINAKEKVRFPLVIRKPFGAKVSDIQIPERAELEEQKDRIIITHEWSKNERVQIVFDFEIKKIRQPASKTVKQEGVYLKRGPLVYAQSFEHTIETVKEYQNSGFYRYKIQAADSIAWNNTLSKDDEFQRVQLQSKQSGLPWEDSPIVLKGTLHNAANGKVNATLVPMGTTILRRVTFSLTDKN